MASTLNVQEQVLSVYKKTLISASRNHPTGLSDVDWIAALKSKRQHPEEYMQHRAVLVFFFAITTAVSGSTPQRNAHTALEGHISGSGGQLVGTWRLISRVVRLEDGTAVQEGLGTTPKRLFNIRLKRAHGCATLET